MKGKSDDADQRKAVMKGLTWSMKEDVAAMKGVIERKDKEVWSDIELEGDEREKLVKAVRAQIREGLRRVERQPFREYSEDA